MTILAAILAAVALASAATEPVAPPDRLAEVAKRYDADALPHLSPRDRYLRLVKDRGADEVVALTTALVRIPTVSADAPEKRRPNFARLAELFSWWASQHGMTFRSVGDGEVFELRWGRGAPELALVFHGDVVPVTAREWTRPAFDAVTAAGVVYGRGVEDDKGPLAAALVAVAMANALGLEPRGQLLVIVGNTEEIDWAPMREYAARAPPMKHVISMDGAFPVMTAQSGNVRWGFEARLAPREDDPDGADRPALVATRAEAGEIGNQVPGRAAMTVHAAGVTPDEAERVVREAVGRLAASRPGLRADVERAGDRLIVETSGAAAHVMNAEQARNALWDLSAIAGALPLRENGVSAMLRVVARWFDGDHHGRKLGIAYEDPFTGELVVAPTLLRTSDDRVTLRVNLRRPQGRTAEEFAAMLTTASGRISSESRGAVVEDGTRKLLTEPYVARSHELIATLLDVYRSRREDATGPVSSRGSTYASLFPGAVDFGPRLPGRRSTAHAPDESVAVADLHAMTEMIADAIERLILSNQEPR